MIWKVFFIPQNTFWRYLLCINIVVVDKMFLNEIIAYILCFVLDLALN